MNRIAKIIMMISLCCILSCDMEYVLRNGPGDVVIIDVNERDELERTGRFLKLINMPRNTQRPNVSITAVANAVANIANIDGKKPVMIYQEETTPTNTVYIPLVYSNGTEFTETGTYYVILTVDVDALTRVLVNRSDNVLVPFTDGRGTLDVNLLPAISGVVIIDVDERDELERTGRYLKLINMPRNTQRPNVSVTAVANAVRSIANIDGKKPVMIFQEETTPTNTVYIPLVYSNGSEFTETGTFFVILTVDIDALTRVVVTRSDNVLVPFTDGRGTLDVNLLPPGVVIPGGGDDGEDKDKIERDIDAIMAAGGYIRFFNLPRNVSKTKISGVSVATDDSVVARCADYETVAVRRLALSSEAFVPLSSTRFSTPFVDTGYYFTAFAIAVDALAQIATDPNDPPLLYFDNGVLNYDVTRLPPVSVPPPREPNALTIVSLPDAANVSNLADVFIWNQAGKVAKCADYTQIKIIPHNGKKAAVIPLVYDNTPQFNGLEFADSGSYLVTFALFPDASQSIVITAANNCVAVFTDGSAVVDLNAIPTIPHNYLTITNLPPQLSQPGVSSVALWTQAGQIAQCEDYKLVSFSSTPSSATIRIPLIYSASRSTFTDTGNYYVSFDINADAVNRILVTQQDAVAVRFEAGNGTFNAATLPSLTITNLPPNVTANGVANVFIRDQAGTVAQCDNYNMLGITNTQSSSTVRIPLNYTVSKSIFTGSGDFFVSFDINADAKNRILVTAKDAVTVRFSSGNGSLNASELPPLPCLTLTGLPNNASNTHILDVAVYGPLGQIARYSSIDDISVVRGASSATATIPLVYVNNGYYFRETGSFYVTFTLAIDLDTYVIIDEENPIRLQFENGSASHDMSQSAGYSSISLVNPTDTAAPVVKGGSSFEINGTFYAVPENTPVNTVVDFSSSTLVYVYAVQRYAGVEFEYSTVAPVFNPAKNGYYSGDKRALWKMYLYKTSAGEVFIAKTPVSSPFPHLSYYTVDTWWDPAGAAIHSLDGTDNPAPGAVTLQPGVYLFRLVGAGGGSGYVSPTGDGGRGGIVAEIVFVDRPTVFTLFTGHGGHGGSPPHEYRGVVSEGGQVSLYAVSAAGGGGGGSGSFIFTDDGYFLCAGGGGGGSGPASRISVQPTAYGGPGGAGGSIGPGGAGGPGSSSTTELLDHHSVPGTSGGIGGGSTLPLPAGITRTGSGFASGPGTADFCQLDPPFSWKNTNNANGQGAEAGAAGAAVNAGSPGGNNRNSTRGGGGNGGIPDVADGTGGPGSVQIYKIGG